MPRISDVAAAPLTIVDLDGVTEPPNPVEFFADCVVGVTSAGALEPSSAAHRWVERAMFTLTSAPTEDIRLVSVTSVDDTLETVTAAVAANPIATAFCDDVLRANSPKVGTRSGLTTESLAYSALQAGPEFARWLAGQPPRVVHEQANAVELQRITGTLTIRFNRPERHNAFSNALQAGLIDGLQTALADESIAEVVFTGRGQSFCSGGDLREFGMFVDPAQAHLARTEHSPALLLDADRERLGTGLRAESTVQYWAAGWRWPPTAAMSWPRLTRCSDFQRSDSGSSPEPA